MARFECGPWTKVGEDDDDGIVSPRYERHCIVDGFPRVRGMVWYRRAHGVQKSGWRSSLWHAVGRQTSFHCCHLTERDAKLEADLKLRRMRRQIVEERSRG